MIQDALTKKAVSVTSVILTPTVPAVSRAVITTAKMARVASVNPVPATEIVKEQWRIVVEEPAPKMNVMKLRLSITIQNWPTLSAR